MFSLVGAAEFALPLGGWEYKTYLKTHDFILRPRTDHDRATRNKGARAATNHISISHHLNAQPALQTLAELQTPQADCKRRL